MLEARFAVNLQSQENWKKVTAIAEILQLLILNQNLLIVLMLFVLPFSMF